MLFSEFNINNELFRYLLVAEEK